jgi:hypothetical protein
MIELLKASFDEVGSERNSSDFALDFISKRTNNAATLKEMRIKYGRKGFSLGIWCKDCALPCWVVVGRMTVIIMARKDWI